MLCQENYIKDQCSFLAAGKFLVMFYPILAVPIYPIIEHRTAFQLLYIDLSPGKQTVFKIIAFVHATITIIRLSEPNPQSVTIDNQSISVIVIIDEAP
jgi:hypothetical protein